jgi:hypothetical protein
VSAEEGFAMLDLAIAKVRTHGVIDDGLIAEAVKRIKAEVDELMWEITVLEEQS